jgi:hypothetical protein
MENMDLLLPPVEDISPKKRTAAHAAGLGAFYPKLLKKPMLVNEVVEGENVEGLLGKAPFKPVVPLTKQLKKASVPQVVVKKDLVFEKASLKYAARKKMMLGWEPLMDNTYCFVHLKIQYQFPLDQVVYLGKELEQPSPVDIISTEERCKHFAFKGVGKTTADKETWQFRKLCQVKECFCICLRGTKCVKHRSIEEKKQ